MLERILRMLNTRTLRLQVKVESTILLVDVSLRQRNGSIKLPPSSLSVDPKFIGSLWLWEVVAVSSKL